MIVLKERGIDAMGEYLRNINWKHVLIMCIGNVFAGMGIGIFKLAGLGTDPFSGMNMAVADMLGISQSYISRLEKKIMGRLKKEIVRLE